MSSDSPDNQLSLLPLESLPKAEQMATPEKHSYGQILKSSALVGGSSAVNIALGIIRTKAMAILLGPAGFGLFGLYGSIANLTQQQWCAPDCRGNRFGRRRTDCHYYRRSAKNINSAWIAGGRLSCCVFQTGVHPDFWHQPTHRSCLPVVPRSVFPTRIRWAECLDPRNAAYL